MRRWMTGWMLLTCALSTWCGNAYAAGHVDEPLALEAIAAYLPTKPDALRLGAGIAVRPNDPAYIRVDVVDDAAGLTVNHRFVLDGAIEISAGLGAYYQVSDHRIRPAVTLARILF